MDEALKTSYLSIGQFATAAQLSIKALRLYHEQDLLTPAYVDPFTSYRYYRTAQLASASAIRILREMELPLSEVKEVLTALETDPSRAQEIVHRYLEKFENRFQAVRRVSELFDQLINH